MGVPHGSVSSVIGPVGDTPYKDRKNSRPHSRKVVLSNPIGEQIKISVRDHHSNTRPAHEVRQGQSGV